jgi:N-acetylglucosaminyl-diphospho-decaprenol L-rhamnosyltransferase
MTRTAVVTVVHGRHQHLLRQHERLASCSPGPDRVVVIAMNDPEVEELVRTGPLGAISTTKHISAAPRLPLAAARNLAAHEALTVADLSIFLDVDCLPSPGLVGAYSDAHARLAKSRSEPTVLAGPVAYLPPPAVGGYDEADLLAASPHPARPAPGPGELVRDTRWDLFWSLSFALDVTAWAAIGGFDESYTGYGGEDTDFGQRARRAGACLWWTGGANAYHQWHPVSDPPVEHLGDIVRNANLFYDRWGWFPMTGWLERFEALGLARFESTDCRWRQIDADADRWSGIARVDGHGRP